MKSLYSELVRSSNKVYDANFVCRALLQIKFSDNESLKNDLKLRIFHSQSKLIVKAINNFFSLLKTIPPEKILHTSEDIASECYIVMFKCIDNLQISNLKKFYFYLNTSLNRAMYRLYERQYKKHFDILPNTDDVELVMMNSGYDDQFDLTSVDLKTFSDLEIKIIEFKFSGDKLSTFLKVMKITNADYQENLELIKEKLIDLYKQPTY